MRHSTPAEFLRHRSHLASDTAVQNLEATVRQVAKLVLKASALADRMEARPVRDAEEARERGARVKVLRDAAHAGREAIRRATAPLASDQAAELGHDPGHLPGFATACAEPLPARRELSKAHVALGPQAQYRERWARFKAAEAGGLVADAVGSRWAVVVRSLGEQQTLEGTFDAILGWALATHRGADEASLSLLGARRNVVTVAATGDLARRSDQAQYLTSEGPCLQAIRQHRTVRVDDLASTEQWRRFAPRGHKLGVRSMLSFHIFVDHKTLGALNLHATSPAAFTQADEEVGEVLAAHAAVAWDHANQERDLRESVEVRGLVGQAQGILMARYEITADEAFDLLRRASQKYNLKITDIARGVIHTGDLIVE